MVIFGEKGPRKPTKTPLNTPQTTCNYLKHHFIHDELLKAPLTTLPTHVAQAGRAGADLDLGAEREQGGAAQAVLRADVHDPLPGAPPAVVEMQPRDRARN